MPDVARRSTLGVATALLCLSVAQLGCNDTESNNTRADETSRAVRVATLQQRDIAGGVTATGLLVARDEAMVGAEIVGYRVAEVLVDEGDQVAKGDPLVRLDDTLLRAQIGQLDANLAEQRAQLELAESEVRRGDALEASGAIPKATLDQQRFARDRWRASVQAAEAHLDELRTRLSRMTIRAPVSGLVVERSVRPGEVAGTGSGPMFRITRDGLVELDAEIPERDLAQVVAGSTARVTLPSGETVEGTVRLVNPAIDPQTKLGRARIALPVRPDLRPGGFARVEIAQTSRGAVMAPESALRFSTDGVNLMLVGDDRRVRSVPVRTGARSDGWVELLEGPPVGTRVIVGGAAFVLEGDVVQVVAADLDPAPVAERAEAKEP